MLHLALVDVQVLGEEFIFVEHLIADWAWERFTNDTVCRSLVPLQIGRIRVGTIAVFVIAFERLLARVNLCADESK